MTRTVVALYCDTRKAISAREELIATGFYKNGGKAYRSSASPEMADVTTGVDVNERLTSAGVPRDRAGGYAEGIRRGGTLIVLSADDRDLELVKDILDRHHPVDLDRALMRWHSEGWTGYNASAQPFTDTEMKRERELTERDAIDLVEEEVKVGKRDVASGGVRVHTYVVETPVEEDVVLREEHVRVDRERVNERISPQAAEAAFVERTVELTEHQEEVVVSKEAHITERVRVGKEVEHHTEHVRETARRQKVDIEHLDEDFDRHEDDYRSHYDTNYAQSGIAYDNYRSAYALGHTYGGNDRYRDRDFTASENDMKSHWERDHGKVGPWQKVKDAVRHAFDRAKGHERDDGVGQYSGTHRQDEARWH